VPQPFRWTVITEIRVRKPDNRRPEARLHELAGCSNRAKLPARWSIGLTQRSPQSTCKRLSFHRGRPTGASPLRRFQRVTGNLTGYHGDDTVLFPAAGRRELQASANGLNVELVNDLGRRVPMDWLLGTISKDRLWSAGKHGRVVSQSRPLDFDWPVAHRPPRGAGVMRRKAGCESMVTGIAGDGHRESIHAAMRVMRVIDRGAGRWSFPANSWRK